MTPHIEDYISARRGAELLGVSMSTFKRYWIYGYHGVFLQTRRIGGRRLTTRQWIKDFIEAQNANVVVCGADEASVDKARERLREEGILN